MSKKETGLIQLMSRSAELLEQLADDLRLGHTIRGKWPEKGVRDHGVKEEYDELLRIVKGLRKAVKYHQVNPLGGPAKMFDAIADRIRTGEKMKRVMKDYDLKSKK